TSTCPWSCATGSAGSRASRRCSRRRGSASDREARREPATALGPPGAVRQARQPPLAGQPRGHGEEALLALVGLLALDPAQVGRAALAGGVPPGRRLRHVRGAVLPRHHLEARPGQSLLVVPGRDEEEAADRA